MHVVPLAHVHRVVELRTLRAAYDRAHALEASGLGVAKLLEDGAERQVMLKADAEEVLDKEQVDDVRWIALVHGHSRVPLLKDVEECLMVEHRVDRQREDSVERRHDLAHGMVLEGERAAEDLGVLGRQPAFLGVRRTLHVELDQMEEPLPRVDARDLIAQNLVEQHADRPREGQHDEDEEVGDRYRLGANLQRVARAYRLRDDLAKDDNQRRRQRECQYRADQAGAEDVDPDGIGDHR
mmetsp:Transcript_29965/g.77623  ORF Transcript_29965/g.77623 Transcript_29965/m.77623 type:complete len:239 (-) Transcript_29965:264-980(-)